jgi:deoxyhypusine synthase
MIEDITIEDAQCAKALVNKFPNLGFQASNLAKGIEITNRMRKDKADIFLTFTANMVASGLRGIFAGLCEKSFPKVIITTAAQSSTTSSARN